MKVAVLIMLPSTELCVLDCHRCRNQRMRAGLFSLSFVFSNRTVANLTTAVFASQRRWGIFVCMNKNCSGSLKLTQIQSNPAASVTTVCLPFHPLTSFTSWLDKTHNLIFISVSRKDELAIKPFLCPTGEGDTNKKMKKSGFDTPCLLQHFQDSYCKASELLLWRVLSQILKYVF